MGAKEALKKELEDLVDAYVSGVTEILKKSGNNQASVKGLADLLKIAQSKAVDNYEKERKRKK